MQRKSFPICTDMENFRLLPAELPLKTSIRCPEDENDEKQLDLSEVANVPERALLFDEVGRPGLQGVGR